MKRIHSCFLSLLICTSIVIALYPCVSLAETCEKWVAKVVSVQGSVEVRRVGETQWQPVKLNETYCPGDLIRVQKKSRADIALINQPVLRLDQDTTITLGGVKEDRTSIVELVKGAAHFFSRVARNLEVRTAFVNGGVEGTEFFIRVEEDKTLLSIFEGKVLASNEEGSLTLTSGQSAVAEAGKAPLLRIVVRPRDAVQWALYYPPIIYYCPADFQGFPETDWRTMVKKSIELYWKGDIAGAFSSIAEVPKDIQDPRFFTYRASLLLTVGRVDEAKADIERVLNLDPKNSNAFALQSIIAVTQNEKDKALSLANKAVGTDPNSASARVALSYAQQANFDLEGALNSLKDAVKLGSENALARARLSELWLSFGRLDEALKAAEKAVALNPNLSRTQTVLGFAYLTQVKTRESKDAFQKAIELDNADPLPRLGLGLAKIRESDLLEGRSEIEIAASLDPDNALIRSYLGKAYYEEKRDKQASEEYTMAEKLDPLDPTSFFYDAIQKQTVNRPVEALHDLQKAIELNDNRAVYRSKLLLDSDLAARSASLARIYSDLGFQQLALVEGWKSVNTDPTDFSGHRFLADSYSALPRHEIARVSELLQSQLLQPINITPLQPHLAESNLFIISGGGPADPSYNEFNPLFNRNGFALQANGIVGENSTFGEEVVASSIYKNTSISAGQFHYETDGFRENNDLTDNIYNAFLQYSLSPETSIQTEFRYRNTKNGDLTLRFFPEDFALNLRDRDERSSIRVGFHHAFSPGSDLIGNFMYQNQDFRSHDSPDPVLILADDKYDADAYSGELQYLLSLKYIKTIIGAGHFYIDSKDVIDMVLDFPPDFLFPGSPEMLEPDHTVIPRDVHHTNLYLYSHIDFPKNVTSTVGVSADFFEGGDVDKNQFNPKFGIIWNPVPDTTLRAAAFRTFKRTLITNQTLEPTQVAGFNQFFDDPNETESWRYGIAIDQKLSKSIYGGAEYSFRDLNFPFVDQSVVPAVVRKVDWDESLARAYLYCTPHKWLALSAEYLYERFKRGEEFALGARKVETHRVPLGINFYHPSGLSAMFKATHINQQGSFERQGAVGTFIHGEDQFWLFDAAIGYRLPKRYGFITVGAKNLFDKSFKYFDTDPVSPAIQPKRFIFARVTLAI